MRGMEGGGWGLFYKNFLGSYFVRRKRLKFRASQVQKETIDCIRTMYFSCRIMFIIHIV